MKLSVTKLIIQLLILLIVVVIMFILSLSLYSIRYWSDVYNYINANITIKRIPTVSELNLTYYDETTDFATTSYIVDRTREDSIDYFDLEDVENTRDRRRVELENDYRELPERGIVNIFFEIEATSRMIDLIDEDNVEMIRTKDHLIMVSFLIAYYLLSLLFLSLDL